MKSFIVAVICANLAISLAFILPAEESCPLPGDEVTYFPDPKDCTKFYECFAGIKTHVECPDGLYWSQTNQICDFPENVICGTTFAPTDLTTITEGNPTEVTTDDSTSGPNCEGDTLKPDPYNCQKYFECDNGKFVELTCPDGLYFNPESLICDFQENVNCATSVSPSTTAGPTDATSDSGTTSNAECPAEGDVLLPNPNDCSKYYECVAGEKVDMDCPDGLLFNADALYCDFPENVDCDN